MNNGWKIEDNEGFMPPFFYNTIQMNNNNKQFAYAEAEELELHQAVKSLLVSSKNSTPFFPPLWSKKITENCGVESNEDTFFNLISNVVDYKMDECVSFIKENALSGSSKKQAKELTIKTSHVESFLGIGDKNLGRPRVYPQLVSNNDQDNEVMPND